MKKFILLLIYSVSLILIGLSVKQFVKEERFDELEYIIEEELIGKDTETFLKENIYSPRSGNFAVIYFVYPEICNPCMTEISEFSSLLNSYDGEPVASQTVIIHTDSLEAARQFMRVLNLDLDYHYDVEEKAYHFLSSYDLRELVGQMIIIDKQKNMIVSRLILETAMPTDMDAKKRFLKQII